jgi:hypothetical protein
MFYCCKSSKILTSVDLTTSTASSSETTIVNKSVVTNVNPSLTHCNIRHPSSIPKCSHNYQETSNYHNKHVKKFDSLGEDMELHEQ